MSNSKTKFTPGPWTVGGVDNKNPITTNLFIRSADKALVAHGLSELANAALISAAPEMFEALEQALMRLQILEINDTTTDIIKHALDKARGES